MPATSAPGRQLQEDHKFKVILGYLRELEASLEYKRQGGRREGGREEREKKGGERTEEMGAGDQEETGLQTPDPGGQLRFSREFET